MLVRQATLDDKPAIFDFIRQAFAGREQYKIPHRWQWQFEDNPFRDEQRLPVWVAFDGDRVVGQTGAMMEPIKLVDRELNVGWSVDTMVLPKYRGQGWGQKLQEANQASHDVFMSLKMSEQNARIKTRLGGFSLPEVHLMNLRLRTDYRVVTDRLRKTSGFVASAASATGAATLAANMLSATAHRRWHNAAQRVREVSADLAIDEVSCFGDDLLPLWHNFAAEYDLLVRREPRYLNWKFTRQPHMDHHRFIARRDQRVVGYVILRQCQSPEPNLGIIVDVVAMPSDTSTIQALIVFAVDWFDRRQVANVKAASSDQRFTNSYSDLGFQTHRRITPICHVRHAILNTRHSTPATAQTLATHHSPLTTFFSYADHDLDQCPQRN